MPLVNAYGARREAEVMQDTWGHLAPRPGRKYFGCIVFTQPAYGYSDVQIIDAEFVGLENSPWLFDDLNWYVDEVSKIQAGEVLRFVGTYQKFKNGRCRFVGRVERVVTVNRVTQQLMQEVKDAEDLRQHEQSA